MNHAARLFAEGLRRRIEKIGIMPGQFPALLELWENDGQTQKQLVEKLNIEQATLANTLIRMERDGLIYRKAHQKDGRLRLIYLTAKAKEIRAQAYKAAQETNDQATADFTPQERAQFVTLLNKAINALRVDG